MAETLPQSSHPETPSGKGAKDENFPVGSFLLPKHLRGHVAAFYAYARAIDDIVDNPDTAPDDKISRLNSFADVLEGKPVPTRGFEKATNLRASLLETNVTTRHGTDLVIAFVQDAVQSRYKDWQSLIGYCEYSANPVGRYLLDLHGEDEAGYKQSDALCTVLQIINHLQDCGDDLHEMDRCYIPTDWLDEEGSSVDDVRAKSMSPGLRQVADRMLDGCELFMQDARQLPAVLKNRHLAMESAVIIKLADRLIQKLRRADSLATRVALSKPDFVLSGVGGAVSGFFRAGRRS